MVFVFVRHAESINNKGLHDNPHLANPQNEDERQKLQRLTQMWDPCLTERGLCDAKTTAKYLAEICKAENSTPIVWTSPLGRAQETALPFLNSGVYVKEHRTIPELQEYTTPNKNPPEGYICDQDWDQFCERVKELIPLIKNVPYEQTVIIFGHSLVFSILLSYIAANEQFPKLEQNVIHLPNCSVTTVGYRESKWEIYNVASTVHLSKPTGVHVLFGNQPPREN